MYMKVDGINIGFSFIDQISTSIRVEVTPVNDQPELKAFKTSIKPIPFNFTSYPGNGTLISRIFEFEKASEMLVKDIDTDLQDLGIAVLKAGNGSIGMWEYKMNGRSSWTEFNITKHISTILLPPYARLVSFMLNGMYYYVHLL